MYYNDLVKKEFNYIKSFYKSYSSTKDFKKGIRQLELSFDFSKKTYFGKKRYTGEPWILHTLRSAKHLAHLELDYVTLSVGLLHDVMDFGVKQEEIQKVFDKEIYSLYLSLLNVKKIKSKYITNSKSNLVDLSNLMLLASSDMRAITIRLVEKLEALKTSYILPKAQQQKELNTALNFYAPFSYQIGLSYLKTEFEDTAFRLTKPVEYKKVLHELKRHPLYNDDSLYLSYLELKTLLLSKGIKFKKIFYRKKTPYSFYKKSKSYIKKGLSTSQIYDRIAFRVITNSVEDCYKVLDILHKRYNFLLEYFDDYISKPKPNGYKSLQTILELKPNAYCEVQVKTEKMHQTSEFGTASHVYYKLYGSSTLVPDKQKLDMLKSLLTWRENLIKKGKILNTSQAKNLIYVFTPKGDIIELPKGATCIDFAYAIHTNIGLKAVRSYVNNKLSPLNMVLKNGDVVEIQIDKSKKMPNKDWLAFVKTPMAKRQIKKYLRRI